MALISLRTHHSVKASMVLIRAIILDTHLYNIISKYYFNTYFIGRVLNSRPISCVSDALATQAVIKLFHIILILIVIVNSNCNSII